MHTEFIDQNEYDGIASAMSDKHETREGGIVLVSGHHHDLGRTTLRREVGVFSVEAEHMHFVRGSVTKQAE